MVTSFVTMAAVVVFASATVSVLIMFLPRSRRPSPPCTVYTAPEYLVEYATDASVFAITPQAVCFPKNLTEVTALVQHTRNQKATGEPASLTVRAGGTCMSGGPLSDGYIVDLGMYMTGVTIDAEARTATAYAGARFRDIEDAAKKHSLMFAPYPSSHRICGIGGMLGNNASGEKSLRYGATSDNVISLDVVLADGSVVTASKKTRAEADARELQIIALAEAWGDRLSEAAGLVKKAASGYRLDKVLGPDNSFSTIPLFVGAQGTLGIITKATLALVPVPEHVSLLAISARSLQDLAAIVEIVYRYNPEALETFDKHTFAKAREHLPVFARTLLPYLDPSAELFILAEFSEGTEDATQAQASDCLAALRTAGLFVQPVRGEHNINAAWQVRRNSFLLMRDHNPPKERAVPCIEDVIVPLPALGEFIAELEPILTKHTTTYGFHGHIGDGSLRIIPVFDFSDPYVTDKIFALMEETFTLVKRLRGNISADHSDGIIRTPFLQEFYGPELYEVFNEIKRLYDPHHLMNPKKKVLGERADIIAHLRR
jgi:FAD/FMN-containing dehydrogenase